MDKETLIRNYRPTDDIKQAVRNTKITLLVGISGAGKDTIKKKLLEHSDFRDIISHTTRPPRTNNGIAETPDIDYHFIDESTALTMLRDHAFVEAKLVHGTIYGTSLQELNLARQDGKIAVTDIDVQGVVEYKMIASSVVAIFILPPTYEIWRERLASRYKTPAEFETEWPKRRASAIDELTAALEVPYYHFIINDDLDRAVQAANEIAHKPDIFHRKDDEARLAARTILESIKANS